MVRPPAIQAQARDTLEERFAQEKRKIMDSTFANITPVIANANSRILDANNSVKNNHLDASSVTSSKIATSAVGAGQIASSAVGNAELAGSAVTGSKIASNAVDTAQIAASAVGNAELAGSAVTGSKIASSAVDNSQIAGSAVTSSKIAASAIGNAQIASSAVTDGEVAGGNKDGNFATPSMRTIGGAASWASGGTSKLASSANHAHSISFKALPKDERRDAIALADKIVARESKDAKYNELREMVLLLFKLAADDISVDRHERERIIDEAEDGDSLEHELYMQHDYMYYARHMLATDARYRVDSKHEPRLAELARDVDGITELEHAFVLDEELDDEGNLKPEHIEGYQELAAIHD